MWMQASTMFLELFTSCILLALHCFQNENVIFLTNVTRSVECWCDSLQCPKRSDFGRVDISDLKSFLCYMHHLDIAVSARKRSAFNWHRNNDKKKRRWEIFYIHSSHAHPRISEMNRYSTDHEKQTYTFPINQRCVCMAVCVFVWGEKASCTIYFWKWLNLI